MQFCELHPKYMLFETDEEGVSSSGVLPMPVLNYIKNSFEKWTINSFTCPGYDYAQPNSYRCPASDVYFFPKFNSQDQILIVVTFRVYVEKCVPHKHVDRLVYPGVCEKLPLTNLLFLIIIETHG